MERPNPVAQYTCNEGDVSLNGQCTQRRSANYKPNIWKYDLLQSLSTEYADDQKYKRLAERLKEEVKAMFVEEHVEFKPKLELIDSIGKLGLKTLFEEEMKEALESILVSRSSMKEEGLYATALCFRLLRQHGYDVSQDMFANFMDENGKFKETKLDSNSKTMVELFEASSFAMEGETVLEEAMLFSNVQRPSELPLSRKVDWYNVKKHISEAEEDAGTPSNRTLVRLAKLNFNMVQATHRQDLMEMSRWWRNIGIAEKLSFTRDRMVESYLWAVGVAYEPQHGNFRKWLTKVIKLILVIDDVYDVYGSFQELQHFTNAVNRWDFKEIEGLPDCIKICFQTLYDTTNEMAFQIQSQMGWTSVLPLLHKEWSNFCNALLMEARWYNEGYTPSLQEYMENGWISSSGPLLCLLVLLGLTLTCDNNEDEITDILNQCQDLVYNISLIVRLCNDRGTSAAELERGDAPSSILCFMREANVTEKIARKHIEDIIRDAWKKINHESVILSSSLHSFVKYTMNIARVVHFIYQNGDGFGVQDRETRDQVLSLLIEPLELS